jgi:hypothetical protein
MHWEDTPPRKAINLGAAFGIPDNPTPFLVCILRVPETDSLPPAFAEFWRRVLTEGVRYCSDRWEVLLFQMNLLGGGFTCVFTSRELDRDEPPVFKFSSEALERACYALPRREPGDPRGELEYQALEDRCLDQLREPVRTGPATEQLRAFRASREFTVLVCDFYRTERWPLDV